LDAKNYVDEGGVGEILYAASQAGVDRMVTPSLHFESFRRLQELSAQYPRCIYPAIGVHPHEVCEELLVGLEQKLADGLEALSSPIIGETGLEGHYDFSPASLQLEFLRAHLGVAKAHGVPVILHCRATEEALHEELRRAALTYPVVVHCFTGSWDWAQRFLDLGCYIGITGIVTFKAAGNVAEVAAKVPLDRLLLETDGPYLAPVPYRGRTNKPEYIPLIAEAVGALRGLTGKQIGETTAANTVRLFQLPELT
jgi:TatD DNase family protein